MSLIWALKRHITSFEKRSRKWAWKIFMFGKRKLEQNLKGIGELKRKKNRNDVAKLGENIRFTMSINFQALGKYKS